MGKASKGVTAAALAVLGTQAFAANPGTPSVLDVPKTAPISVGTGLTSLDLLVGLDGTVAFDVHAHGLQVACASGVQENSSCTNVCCS